MTHKLAPRLATLLALAIPAVLATADTAAQDPPAKARPARPAKPARGATAPARVAPTPQRAAPKAQPASAAIPSGPVEVAREAAAIARSESACLRDAAQGVQLAAQRLASASALGDGARIGEERGKLDGALGVLDECRNGARQRLEQLSFGTLEAGAPPAPAPAVEEPERRSAAALFSFGGVRVERGDADVDDVVKSLRRRSSRLASCYQQSNEPVDGKAALTLRLAEGERGARVTSIGVGQNTLSDPRVKGCLARALMGTSFPRSAAGSDVSLEIGFAQPRR
jgi:hypothetical protein